MKKVPNYLTKALCSVCIVLLVLALSGCTGKKSGSTANQAKAQTEVKGKPGKEESRNAKKEKQLKRDREKLYGMRSEYRELARQVMNTPDPMERSRISDKMDRLNRRIGDLETEMLQKYGKAY